MSGQNREVRKDSISRIRGVRLRKDNGKYSASITTKGKTVILGCFDSLSEATAVRHKAEQKYHKQFSSTLSRRTQ